ncbi:cutinase [Mycolicibacterium grossiae]|uniref:Cutinase n=1 Tax=Mycolicibacterium grossiae TaxID=1552759 RepID=A0A1E8Q0C6_9MYCO|nr:cutinase family protein [Mycolicibacterium grossiae]OFJ51866.1 cutinase [Mycolicibacterium grossiae]
MKLHHRLAALTTAPLVSAALLLHTAPAALAANCPAIQAIAVPGTTQTTPDADPNKPVGVLGDILEPLRKNSPVRLVTYYTPYPATIVGGTDGGGYRASKNSGIDATNARLKSVANACPSTVFILTGYSQGADVAGDVAAAIGNNRGVIPASRLLGVALVADPSQAPVGQPTIGLPDQGLGFAGVRSGGFGSLTQRNGLLSVCAPRDYYCNLPQGELVMRMIGHLGSQLDAADPSGSAKKLATLFMTGLVAPATAAITQILKLVSDPNLIPNLVSRGIAFAKALAQQLFWLAGPQVAAPAADLVNAVTNVINLVTSRAWTAIPAAITVIANRANAVGTALAQMKDRTTTINVNGFGPVGAGLAQPGANIGNLATAVLNAINIATGGLGTQATGMFGPTFSQFSAANVAAALKRYAEFIKGGFHESYSKTPLDKAGHTGTQIVQRYFVNQINKLV